jgi:putative tryptophan/tyrosine transport system substrate-binding protein
MRHPPATRPQRLPTPSRLSPVQFPTKYQLVVNMKTANAIGLTMAEAFLVHADELIE